MKTERITFLGSSAFKQGLERQARAQGISVGELIRRRFDAAVPQTEEEVALAALAGELRRSVREARASLADALKEANATLGSLAARREKGRSSSRPPRKVA